MLNIVYAVNVSLKSSNSSSLCSVIVKKIVVFRFLAVSFITTCPVANIVSMTVAAYEMFEKCPDMGGVYTHSKKVPYSQLKLSRLNTKFMLRRIDLF